MTAQWLRRTSSLDYFVFRAEKAHVPAPTAVVVPAGTRFTWWTPAWNRIFPPYHRKLHFFFWWLLDRLGLFPAGQYAVLVVMDKDGAFVGRVCVIPTWWHTPFMKSRSVQLSGIETVSEWRRRGIALAAVEFCLERIASSASEIYYIARAANLPSHALARSAGLHYVALAHKTPDTFLGRFTIGGKTKPWRVLVVQAWGIGDAIMTISLLRLIRMKLPGARIVVVVGGAVTGEVLLSAQLADDVVVLPQRSTAWQRIRTFSALRKDRFDCAMVATGLHWAYAVLARWVAGIPRVIGDRRSPFLPTFTTFVPSNRTPHRLIANGHLLQPIVPDITDEEIAGIDPLLPDPEISETASRFLRDLDRSGEARVYAIHLGSGGQNVKRVPPELALSIIEELSQRAAGARFLYIEGPDDPPFDSLPSDLRQRMTRIAGWPAGDLRRLLGQCDAVLSGDTGIAHLSAASGGKAVVLAGPTDVRRTRPWGDDHVVVTTRTPPACMPCYDTKMFHACPYGIKCMTSITPGDAASAMASGKSGRASRPVAAR